MATKNEAASRAARTRARRDSRNSIIAAVLFVALAVIVATLFGCSNQAAEGPSDVERVEQGEGETTVTPVAASSLPTEPPVPANEPGPTPYTRKGIKSIEDWARKADRAARFGNWGWWESVMGLNHLSYNQARNVVDWHIAKEADGRSYVTTVGPGGLAVINTAPRSGRYRPFRTTLLPGDKYLALDPECPYLTRPPIGGDGFRMGCGNPINGLRPIKFGNKLVRKDEADKPDEEDEPHESKSAANTYGPPQRPGNPTYGNPAPNPMVIPGYTPGNAERVVEEQNSQPPGGMGPTPSGTPGTGTGGGAVTPPATTVGDGVSEEAPPPTTPPDTGIAGETSTGETGDVE